MKTLSVDLGDRTYPIYIGAGVLQQSELILQHVKHKQVAIVTNETVAPIYGELITALLRDKQINVIELPDGEKYKNWQTLNAIFDALVQHGHHRTTTLIALGGGVVGDMCGFAAACYQRGVNFIQIPTTLLSQVDSSVGGKTGINHPQGKNMIGAFYQPQAVAIDVSVLNTLPQKELSAGLAEVIKYGAIYDADFFSWLEKNMGLLLALDQQALTTAIEKSCKIKAEIVAQDEREGGIRAWLNFGHTFGHAIEAAQGYGNWLHGEAVAAGMVMAAHMSHRLGWLAEKDLERLTALVQQARLPIAPPVMTEEQFLTLMAGDKKVLDGNLRLVLLKKLGQSVVTSDFPHQALLETLQSFR